MSSAYFNTEDFHSLEVCGFKLIRGGAHNSRTMMLAELEMVLRAVDENAKAPDYADAILTQNVLAKDTVSTRKKTFSHLKELYSLSPGTPLFRVLRRLYRIHPASLPQLAVLTAVARDPLLRASTETILHLPEGGTVTPDEIDRASEPAPGDVRVLGVG